MIDVATKILLHDKLRFVITVSGVAFAVTLVLVQVGLFLGLLDNASITIQKCNAVRKGVSLELRRGEAVVLEGPSGSGKTTLLSILGCILTPTAGEVVIEGERVAASRPAKLAALRRRAIGFVFQQFNLFGALTAQENVEYALNLKGRRGIAARREAARWMDLVGLADRRRFLPRDLSGGQKQRVAIARALAGEASIVLADEPTANLDFQTGQMVLELFRQLAREHQRALLIVTHDPRVRPLTDRTLFLRDGILSNSPEAKL